MFAKILGDWGLNTKLAFPLKLVTVDIGLQTEAGWFKLLRKLGINPVMKGKNIQRSVAI